jgi:hypothetical protein
MFEQRAPHVHFALDPANKVAGPRRGDIFKLIDNQMNCLGNKNKYVFYWALTSIVKTDVIWVGKGREMDRFGETKLCFLCQSINFIVRSQCAPRIRFFFFSFFFFLCWQKYIMGIFKEKM